MASIKISTGLKVYDIEDENGNIRGQVSFNPADVNFFARAQEFNENIGKWLEMLDSIKDKEFTDDEAAKEIKRLDDEIKRELNILFDDENASSVVFGNQSVFNTLSGVTFLERFIQAFIPIITKEFQKEQKKSSQRVNKYLEQVK